MNRFTSKLYSFCLRSLQVLTLLLTGLFLVSGFLFTCFASDMATQEVLLKWDSPLLAIPAMILGGVLLFAIAALACRKPEAHRLLRALVLAWYVSAGILLILFGRSAPTADQATVYKIAESLAGGDASVIHPTDSYLSFYPQQIGLTAYYELLIRLWRLLPVSTPPYHFIKLVNVLWGGVILLCGENLVHTLWKDQRTDCLYLLLAGLNVPLVMYTSFVYGEIPSYAALSVGMCLLARLLTGEPASACRDGKVDAMRIFGISFSPRTGILAFGVLFFFSLSVLLRKNSLIFVIAAVIVLLLCSLKKRPWLILLAVLCTVGALAVLPVVQKYYECRSGSTLSSGVPALSYFAMGMQESSRGNGWYNGFNFYTYQDVGLDSEAAIRISRDAIRERLAYFGENPGYAARFYLLKYLSQWADGTYACRQSTLFSLDGRYPVFASLYEGNLSPWLVSYCNVSQNLCYLGAFLFCLMAFRRSVPSHLAGFQLPAYMGLIAVVGGFLFHMAWEANSRYILLYGLTLLPYTARGLSLLWDRALSVRGRLFNADQSREQRVEEASRAKP